MQRNRRLHVDNVGRRQLGSVPGLAVSEAGRGEEMIQLLFGAVLIVLAMGLVAYLVGTFLGDDDTKNSDQLPK